MHGLGAISYFEGTCPGRKVPIRTAVHGRTTGPPHVWFEIKTAPGKGDWHILADRRCPRCGHDFSGRPMEEVEGRESGVDRTHTTNSLQERRLENAVSLALGAGEHQPPPA